MNCRKLKRLDVDFACAAVIKDIFFSFGVGFYLHPDLHASFVGRRT
jgi:hypothetical protein